MKLEWLDLFMRIIPESLIIILASYAFSRKQFNGKLYLLASIIHAVCTFLIKGLPIGKLMPMILSAVVAVIIIIMVNRIPPLNAIVSVLLCFVLSIVFEGVNMMFLQVFLKLDPQKVFEEADVLTRNIYGLPSFTVFAITILICFFVFRKKRRRR